jgi:hypothetical protein
LKWQAIGFVLLAAFSGSVALAGDLSWSGLYRTEGVFIRNPGLDSGQNLEDSYLTHHLILSPKIIPMDGVIIKARFDIFNNALGNNQIGQVMGSYTGNTQTAAGQGSPAAVMTKSQQDETIRVTEMYMNWVNEFGALVVGRVPFHFGLGMLFNDGSGPFDHWLSTKDMVAYRIALGNMTIMPAYGKVLSAEEIAQVALYVQSLKTGSNIQVNP